MRCEQGGCTASAVAFVTVTRGRPARFCRLCLSDWALAADPTVAALREECARLRRSVDDLAALQQRVTTLAPNAVQAAVEQGDVALAGRS